MRGPRWFLRAFAAAAEHDLAERELRAEDELDAWVHRRLVIDARRAERAGFGVLFGEAQP